MHVERDGYVGIADVGNGQTTVALVVPAARARRDVRRPRRVPRGMAARSGRISPRGSRRATRVSPVVATGPFASHARRAWAPGVALVGDAADFFDPFTGEGIYSALRGGEMLADAVQSALAARTAATLDRAARALRCRAPRGVPRQVDRRARDRRGGRVGAADQSRREGLVGAQGSRGSAHRRDGRLRAGARGDPARVSLEGVWPGDRLSFGAMIDSDTFRSVLGRFASGITIVTARDDAGQDHGMTVSAFCSLSLEPRDGAPLRRSRRVDARAAAGASAVRRQHSLIGAGSSIRAASPPRSSIGSTASRTRAANTASCCSTTRSRISSAASSRHYDAGDHTIFIAEVERADAARRTAAALLSRRLRAARAMTRVLTPAAPARRRDPRRPGVDPAVRERSIDRLTRSNRWLGGLRAALACRARGARARSAPTATIARHRHGPRRHPGPRAARRRANGRHDRDDRCRRGGRRCWRPPAPQDA